MEPSTPPSPSTPPAMPASAQKPVARPGIKPETLVALGIRHVTHEEANALVGTFNSGIYIPYPGIDGYGRLRLDEPANGKKYHQAQGTPPRTYIPVDLTLLEGDLIAVEGEFKAISLCEGGFPAVGLSGFYSWRIRVKDEAATPQHEIEPGFAAAVAKLNPKRIVFIGDSDTATNFQFSDAVLSMATLLNRSIVLPRIDYGAADGKGVDDVRGKLGDIAFASWMKERLRTAIVVDPKDPKSSLAQKLLEREETAIANLELDAKGKALARLAKFGVFADRFLCTWVAEFAKRTLDIPKGEFKRAVDIERKKQREGSADVAQREVDPDILDQFAIVGSAYYGFSVNPLTQERSKVLSPCNREFVFHELRAAGYSTKRDSDEQTPICGKIEDCSMMAAAMLHLHRTRYVSIVDRLFRPYGRLAQPDGSCVFNNSRVKPVAPLGTVDAHTDPKIKFTVGWLTALLGWDQLKHFLCILSYTYLNARRNDPKKPLAVFFVGPTDSGKSLLIDFWMPRIFGQTAAGDVHRLLLGENGASSVLGCYICKMSDKDLGNAGDVRRTRDGMLALLADHTTGGKLMNQNVTVEEVLNLFAFSSNPDGSVVKLLKGMSESIRSKLAVYSCERGLQAMSAANFAREDIDHPAKALERELPHFCSFLENWPKKHGFTKHYHSTRFGVQPFYSPSIARSLSSSPEETNLLEAIEDLDEAPKTARQLYNKLTPKDPSLRSMDMTKFRVLLRQLAETHSDLVVMKSYRDGRGETKNQLFEIRGTAWRKLRDEAAVKLGPKAKPAAPNSSGTGKDQKANDGQKANPSDPAMGSREPGKSQEAPRAVGEAGPEKPNEPGANQPGQSRAGTPDNPPIVREEPFAFA